MKGEFVGRVIKFDKKEYNKKVYYKNILKEVETGRLVSLSTDTPLEVDEWYNVRGELQFSDYQGKTYISLKRPEWVTLINDVPF